MLTRREAVVGGLLACTCRAQAAKLTSGCILADHEVERFFTERRAFSVDNDPIVTRSGDREFDFALAQTLSPLSDTFQVLPGFAYFNDSDSPNAYASPVVRMARTDGTVFFGQRFLKKLLALPEQPDVAVTAVCAHEFGHILQFKLNLSLTDKRLELHADYLAGYYAGVLKLKRPDYPAAVFATQQFLAGGLNHGTSDERAAAVVRGFEVAYRERRNLPNAVQIGINYVSRTDTRQ